MSKFMIVTDDDNEARVYDGGNKGIELSVSAVAVVDRNNKAKELGLKTRYKAIKFTKNKEKD